MTKNIVLIGYMGSGKTTIGKMLSSQMNYNFIDTDDFIASKKQMSIPLIFKEKGEKYFRDCETKALKEVIQTHTHIIATGGGIVTKSDNINILRKGIVIYLKASPSHIYNNVKRDTNRPLLQRGDMYSTICSMLEEREELYKSAAHETINVSGKTPQEITALISNIVKGGL